MNPVAAALDILQGEERAYMGLLLPTIASLLNAFAGISGLEHCSRLHKSLVQGIKNRFGRLFTDADSILASATHPNYRLSRWLVWLPDVNPVEIRKMATCHLSKLLKNSEAEKHCNQTEETSGNEPRGLLHALYDDTREDGIDQVVKAYLEERLHKGPLTVGAFPTKAFQNTFFCYNTPIPSSAAVERIFSMSKDILKPKRNKISDEHFQMLVFFRGNSK